MFGFLPLKLVLYGGIEVGPFAVPIVGRIHPFKQGLPVLVVVLVEVEVGVGVGVKVFARSNRFAVLSASPSSLNNSKGSQKCFFAVE